MPRPIGAVHRPIALKRRPLNKKSPLSDFFLHIQQIFTNFAVQIKLYYYD